MRYPLFQPPILLMREAVDPQCEARYQAATSSLIASAIDQAARFSRIKLSTPTYSLELLAHPVTTSVELTSTLPRGMLTVCPWIPGISSLDQPSTRLYLRARAAFPPRFDSGTLPVRQAASSPGCNRFELSSPCHYAAP